MIPAGTVHFLEAGEGDPLEFVIFGVPPVPIEDERARPVHPSGWRGDAKTRSAGFQDILPTSFLALLSFVKRPAGGHQRRGESLIRTCEYIHERI